jgi:rhamnose transport system permease protein
MQFLRKLQPFLHEILLGLLLIAVLLVAARIDTKGFISASTQQSLTFNVWDMALLALPMTLIIITGGIDLSVGSTMALASVTLGLLNKLAGVPIWPAAAAAVVVAVLCGLLNGFFITRIRVHPLIVTLATYSAFRGLAEGLSLACAAVFRSQPVYDHFPAAFTALGTHAFFAGENIWNPPLYALSAAGWLFFGAALFLGITLAKTPFGRTLYAIGHNETAARYSGLRVDRAKIALYTLSGLMAGLVALNYTAYNDSAQASVGNGIELDVITAVVLGGTSIFGGRGRIIGTVLGVALIHETREFVSWHFHQNELVKVVLGVLLIFAVAANALLSRRSRQQ